VSRRDQTHYLKLTCGERFDHRAVLPVSHEPCVTLTKSTGPALPARRYQYNTKLFRNVSTAR